MATTCFATNGSLKALFCLLLLALSFANSARILDEVDPLPDPTIVPPTTTLPSGQLPATTAAPVATTTAAPVATTPDQTAAPPLPELEIPPSTDVAPPPADVAPEIPATAPTTTPLPVPTTTTTTPAAATSATVANPMGPQTGTTPHLSFYMHDILGGTHPSTRVVTGIIARTDINGIPFSEPNNNIFPLQGGTPLVNLNNINNFINPNTAPFITGLNPAQTNTILQNTGNQNNVVNGNNQPFVTAGQLPAGSTLQKLMFGSITVVDDELTEGEELGSAVMGRAQGFYLVSSLDGTSHTVALTLLLHPGVNNNNNNNNGINNSNGNTNNVEIEDTISLFGVHRAASGESQVAVVGGTGEYENASGYATLETILHQENQHTTDGVDTLMHISLYLS